MENYIKQLFQVDYVPPLAQKQLKDYMASTERQYTYSGILKTLKYFYEIKHGDISKARNGIGIVSFVYDDAYRYWRSIWEAQQANKRAIEKENSIAQIPKIEIHITSPKREPMGRNKRNNFSFLDEDVGETGEA
ncbi:MAG: hypothetical protein NC218_11440 [Acetobacter sp.]|nr:hypothetical protein [Acetobacter sp.]